MDDRTRSPANQLSDVEPMPRQRFKRARAAWLGLGLPAKLLLLTTAFVMLAEVLIFVPSVANQRVNWLNDRLRAAKLAGLAAEAVPDHQVPKSLRAELLSTAEVKAVAWRRKGVRRMVLPPVDSMTVDAHYDLRSKADAGLIENIGMRFGLIGDAMAVFFRGPERTIRVIGSLNEEPGDSIEIILPEAKLRSVMVSYGLNILGLSIIISLITAALVYLALSSLLVRPMMRFTRNMLHFGEDPEDTSRIISPSDRSDEIGTAERELEHMQRQLSHLLLQKNRLAQLGLAVSKINHDLRNMLANAQLISDRLSGVADPTVQRFAPKLIASLDRAIAFCNSSLRFGRAEEEAPRRQLLALLPLVEEVGDGLGLPCDGNVEWVVEIDPALRIDADREHLLRVLSNIVRNSVQALEAQDERSDGKIMIEACRDGRSVMINIRDNGPGIPERAKENLFRAFQGSFRKGGTGLGLAIAAELIAAHGGKLTLVEVPVGTAFEIVLPDRVA